MRLEGKVAAITGGASGFGEGMAQRFAAEGASVVINDVQASKGETVAGAIRDEGGAALFREGNVADDGDMKDLVDAATSEYGRLDCFIANAGVTHISQPLLDVEEDDFDRIFDVNVKGIYQGARHAIPAIQEAGGGSFLITASTAGIRPRPGLVWYAGTKGAAIAIAKGMALAVARDNIRVNAICPVAGDTPLLPQFTGADTPEAKEAVVRTIPLRRLATALDVANAALYLASDEGAFITGTAFEVDGGRCI